MKDTATWSQVGQRLGTQPGGKYKAPGGRIYYVKESRTETHALNEVLASSLYALAGVKAARCELVLHNGSLGVASPWITEAEQDLYKRLQSRDSDFYKAKIRQGFAVDAWLANWDVAGLVFDNIVSDAYADPVRVDTGGCLLYRAMGAPKGAAFGPKVNEWDTLRDFARAPEAAHLFATMGRDELESSAVRVASIRPSDIAEAVLAVGFDIDMADSLTQTLLDRRADIFSRSLALRGE